MKIEDRDLAIASSVADGEPVEWKELETEAPRDPLRARLLEAFRVIELVRSTHDSASSVGTEASLSGREVDPPEISRWRHLEILGRVGAGSFGDVYRARDPHLDRVVALKLLRRQAGEASSSAAVEEGRLLAKVKHSNVATVYGADRDQERVGVWMEFIQGGTLAAMLDRHGPFGGREATLIGIDLCGALAAVHGQGVIHRDIKAQNVMREQGGRIVLMDFGIGREHRAGAESGVAGTPLYMAPEVLEGEGSTTRSDIYSLGVLLFHLVTGRFPVEGASTQEIRERQRGGRALLRDLRPDLAPSFVDAVERALANDPGDRYQSAGAMERQLLGALVDSEVPAEQSKGRRIKTGAWLLAALIVLGGLALGWVSTRDRPEDAEARALYERALQLRAQEGLDPAISLLRRAVELDEEFALAYATLADFYEGKGMYEEALRAADMAFANSHRVASLVDRELVRGTAFSTRMQMRDAVEAFAFAAESTDDPELWRKKAEAEAILGRSDFAIESFRRAIVREPDHLLTRGFRALLLGMTRKYDAAFQELREGRRILRERQPGDSEVSDYPYFYWGEGITLMVRDNRARGDMAAAGEAFTKLAQGGPTFVSYGRFFLAQWLAYQGRLREAIHELEDSLPLDNQEGLSNPMAMRLNRIAHLHSLLGEKEQALSRLRALEALPTLPIFVENLRDMALHYVELGELDGAERILARLRQLEQDYGSEFSTGFRSQIEGELALARGDLGQAGRALEEAARTHDDPLVVRSWARLLVRQERYAQAELAYRKILSEKGRILQWHSATVWVLAHRELARCQLQRSAELARSDPAESQAKARSARLNQERFAELWERPEWSAHALPEG